MNGEKKKKIVGRHRRCRARHPDSWRAFVGLLKLPFIIFTIILTARRFSRARSYYADGSVIFILIDQFLIFFSPDIGRRYAGNKRTEIIAAAATTVINRSEERPPGAENQNPSRPLDDVDSVAFAGNNLEFLRRVYHGRLLHLE